MITPTDDTAFVVRMMSDTGTASAYHFAIENVRLMHFTDVFMFGLMRQMSSPTPLTPLTILDDLLSIVFASAPPEALAQARAIVEEHHVESGIPALNEEIAPVVERLGASPIRLLAEMLICRMADNFSTYLSSLLTAIYLSRPEMLRSSEQVTQEFVLQFATMDDLVAGLAERRVNELAYRGFRELVAYSRKHGMGLFGEDGPELDEVARIIEIRNVLVHNRGVVSATFKRRLPDYPRQVGEHIQYEENFYGDAETLTAATFAIDARAVAKFGLETVPLRLKQPAAEA